MDIIGIIKERLHIEDIIGWCVPLTKTGKHLREQLFFNQEVIYDNNSI